MVWSIISLLQLTLSHLPYALLLILVHHPHALPTETDGLLLDHQHPPLPNLRQFLPAPTHHLTPLGHLHQRTQSNPPSQIRTLLLPMNHMLPKRLHLLNRILLIQYLYLQTTTLYPILLIYELPVLFLVQPLHRQLLTPLTHLLLYHCILYTLQRL